MRASGDILGLCRVGTQLGVDLSRDFSLIGRGAEWRSEECRVGDQILAKVGVEKSGCFDGALYRDIESGVVAAISSQLFGIEEKCDEKQLGCDFASRPAKRIVEEYLRNGLGFLGRLRGGYALALWDPRDQKAIIARDPTGLKPIYYQWQSGVFLFSSDVASLRRSTMVGNELDDARLFEYVAMLHSETGRTLFKDVRRLPAGCYLVASEGSIEIQRYWSISRTRWSDSQTLDKAARELAAVFEKTVSDRLSDGRPAFMLSGGLDSSSIVAVARKISVSRGAPPVTAFCGIFPELSKRYPKLDERVWMESIITQGHVDAKFVNLEGVDPLDCAFWNGDEPCSHPNLYLETEIFRNAAELGFDSVFSGFDGDTTIGYGINRLAELFRDLRWLELHDELCALLQNTGGSRYARTLLYHAVIPSMPKNFILAVRSVKRKISRQAWPIPRLMNADFARANRFDNVLEKHWGYDFFRSPDRNDEVFDPVTTGMLDRGVELLEKAARHTGVKCQLPFMDSRLIETSVGIPEKFKMKGGVNRFVMREAMRGLLPELVRNRISKQNISANVLVALHQKCLSRMESVICAGSSPVARYFDIQLLKRSYEAFANDPFSVDQLDVLIMFNATCLGLWLQYNDLA